MREVVDKLLSPASPCGKMLPGPALAAPRPGRVELIVNGRLRPVCSPDRIVMRSNQFWGGYRLEVVRMSSVGELEQVATPCNRIVYAAAGTYDVRYRAYAHTAQRRLSPGTFCFVRRGYEFERIAWKAKGLEAVIVDITDLGADPSPVDAFGRTDALFDMYVGIEDSRVTALIELMRAEIEAGCPTGVVYGESLSLALASRVASICTAFPEVRRQAATLSARQLRLVTEYIATHLAHELTIEHLAALVNLSPFHFARCFRQATGSTPHRFVIRERIARAREMLSSGGQSIGDVAMALGFASQSHFADVYRRVTGTTPRRDRTNG